jgi:SAM-dependent methyltransferase
VSDLSAFYEGWAAERERSETILDYERQASRWKWREMERLIRTASRTPRSILEFGCGSGEMLELAGQAFPDAVLHGIDLSERMVAMAGARLPRARLQAGGIERLESRSERVDLVLAVDILEHLPDPARAMRALGLAGRDVALKIPLEKRVIRLGWRRQKPGPEHHIAGHLHFWTLGQSRSLIRQGGLRIVAENCVDPPEAIRYHAVTQVPPPGADRALGGRVVGAARRAHHAMEVRLERWSCLHHPTLHRLLFGSSHFVIARRDEGETKVASG